LSSLAVGGLFVVVLVSAGFGGVGVFLFVGLVVRDKSGVLRTARIEILHVGVILFSTSGAAVGGALSAFFALSFFLLLLVKLATTLVAAIAVTRQCLVRSVAAVTTVTTATVAAVSTAATTASATTIVATRLGFVDT
jgi:hypothetical protein